MELRRFTQLQSGETLRTLTTSFTEGQGFLLRCFDQWRGCTSETHLSGRTWFSTEDECEQEMRRMESDLKTLGWS